MKYLLIYIFVIGLSISLKAQDQIQGTLYDFNKLVREDNYYDDPAINGTPYDYDEFVDGCVLDNHGVRYDKYKLRYNILDDEIQFKDGDKIMAIPDKSLLKEVVIGDDVIVPIHTDAKNKNRIQYMFRVADTNRVEVLIMKYKRFTKAIEPKAYADAVPATISTTSKRFFVSIDKNIPVEVKSNKSFVKLLPEHQSKVESYIKKNKFKIKNTDDLHRIMTYYSSL